MRRDIRGREGRGLHVGADESQELPAAVPDLDLPRVIPRQVQPLPAHEAGALPAEGDRHRGGHGASAEGHLHLRRLRPGPAAQRVPDGTVSPVADGGDAVAMDAGPRVIHLERLGQAEHAAVREPTGRQCVAHPASYRHEAAALAGQHEGTTHIAVAIEHRQAAGENIRDQHGVARPHPQPAECLILAGPASLPARGVEGAARAVVEPHFAGRPVGEHDASVGQADGPGHLVEVAPRLAALPSEVHQRRVDHLPSRPRRPGLAAILHDADAGAVPGIHRTAPSFHSAAASDARGQAHRRQRHRRCSQHPAPPVRTGSTRPPPSRRRRCETIRWRRPYPRRPGRGGAPRRTPAPAATPRERADGSGP